MSTERSALPFILLIYGILLLLIFLLARATMTTTDDHEQRIQQLEQKK